MIVALYDHDFNIKNKGRVSFSIDLMKLSAYYKNLQDIAFLINNFKNANLYNRIIYNADFNNPVFSSVKDIDNIQFRGVWFDSQVTPLNEDIERRVNDVSLYENFIEKNTDIFNKYALKKCRHLLKYTCNIRIAPKGIITDNYERDIIPKRSYVIHDENFFYLNGWKDFVKDIEKQRQPCFGFRYTQDIEDINDFFFLQEYGLMENSSRYHILKINNNEDFKRLATSYKGYLLCDVECLNRNSDNVLVMSIELRNLIKRILFLKAKDIRFSLINTKKIYNKDLENLINTLLIWSKYEQQFSFYEYYNSSRFITKRLDKLKINTTIKRYNLRELLVLDPLKYKEGLI